MLAADGKKTKLVAFLTVFIDMLGVGIIIPIQAFYAESLGASPTEVTLLGASFSLMMFLFAPFWGRLSDRIGRRPVVLLSVSIAFTGYIIFGFSDQLWILFASRMLAGFGSANIATVQAIMADITTTETRSKSMGMVGAAIGLGFTLGPGIGGVAGQISPSAPAFFAAVLALTNFLLALKLLPETKQKTTEIANPKPSSRLKIGHLISSHRGLGLAFLTNFLFWSAFAMVEQILGLYIEHTWLDQLVKHDINSLKVAAAITAIYLVVNGISIIAIQGGFIGRLTSRFGQSRLISSGLLFGILALLAAPWLISTKAYLFLVLSSIILAWAPGLFSPSMAAKLSSEASEESRGEVLGTNQSAAALGRTIGPSMAGVLFEQTIALPFYVGSMFMLVGFIVWKVREGHPTPSAR